MFYFETRSRLLPEVAGHSQRWTPLGDLSSTHHVSADGHGGTFKFGIIMNRAAMNILTHVFGEHMYQCLLGIFLVMEFLH